MSTIAACPVCKTNEHVRVNPDYIGFTAHCDNCYDVDCQGDPPQFVSLRPVSHGSTEEEAIAAWNDRMLEE